MNFKCLFGHRWKNFMCTVCNARQPKPKLRSFGKETKGKYTYEYYAASSADEARLFLSYREVTEPLYYIQVETPEGIWGLDKDGLYLVGLLPFQKNLSLSQCTGKISSINPLSIGVQMAAKGNTDNFVCGIVCGSCGCEWKDGVRLREKTVVKCPQCGKYNCVDTSTRIECIEYGNGQTLLKSTVEI